MATLTQLVHHYKRDLQRRQLKSALANNIQVHHFATFQGPKLRFLGRMSLSKTALQLTHGPHILRDLSFPTEEQITSALAFPCFSDRCK